MYATTYDSNSQGWKLNENCANLDHVGPLTALHFLEKSNIETGMPAGPVDHKCDKMIGHKPIKWFALHNKTVDDSVRNGDFLVIVHDRQIEQDDAVFIAGLLDIELEHDDLGPIGAPDAID